MKQYKKREIFNIIYMIKCYGAAIEFEQKLIPKEFEIPAIKAQENTRAILRSAEVIR